MVPAPGVKWLAATGGMDQAEMLKTFNAGQGMVLVVDHGEAKAIRALLEAAGETVTQLGTVTHGEGVKYLGSLT